MVRVDGRLACNAPVALRELSIAGLGVALLPDWLVAEALSTGRLRRVLPGDRLAGGPVTALYRVEQRGWPRLRPVLEALKEGFRAAGQGLRGRASAKAEPGADLFQRQPLDAEPLAASVLAGDQRDRPPGQVELPGQQLHNRLVRGALQRWRADAHLERSVADRSEPGTGRAWLRPDRQLDAAGDLPEGVRYGVPAFLGARNETLSSTRTDASVSCGATTSSSFR